MRKISHLFLLLILLGLFMAGDMTPTLAAPDAVSSVPTLISIIPSKTTLSSTDTFSIALTVSDSSGTGDLSRVWLGFQNCNVDPGEGFNSNFERNFANYFGAIVYELSGGWSVASAQNNAGAACTGGTLGASVWGASAAPYLNTPGTTELTSVSRSVNGTSITYTFNLKLSNHPAGTFPIYYMLKDLAGNYQGGLNNVYWSRSSVVLTVAAPTAAPTNTPTPTPTPASSATPTQTATPTKTPVPNLPPDIQSITISPNPAGPNDLVSITIVFSDPNGTNDLVNVNSQMFMAASRCSAQTYQFAAGNTPMTNFEASLGDTLGIGHRKLGTSLRLQAASGTNLLLKDCSDTVQGVAAGPFYAVIKNNWETASVYFKRLAVTSVVTWQYSVHLNDFPDGTYNLYYAVADKNGLFQDGTTTGSWNIYPSLQFTVNPSSASELSGINNLRALANLPPVTYNTAFETGAKAHAKYIVKNNDLSHTETSGNPWYTLDGAAAGQSSLVLGSLHPGLSDTKAIEKWISGPFHALGMLNPLLTQVSYGAYREPASYGSYQMAAVLDVYRGIDYFGSASYPVFFPANGQTTSISTYYGGSTPDPLAPCPGYTLPSGAPIIVQFGSGNTPVSLTDSSFKQGTTNLPYCIYTETSYRNPNSRDQSVGRSILGSQDAVVIIPKNVLGSALTYSVSLTVNGVQHSWSFSTAPASGGGSIPSVNILSPIIEKEEVCKVDVSDFLVENDIRGLSFQESGAWHLRGIAGRQMEWKIDLKNDLALDLLSLFYLDRNGFLQKTWVVAGFDAPQDFGFLQFAPFASETVGSPGYLSLIEGIQSHQEVLEQFNTEGKFLLDLTLPADFGSGQDGGWNACQGELCSLQAFVDSLYGSGEDGVSLDLITTGNAPSAPTSGLVAWTGRIEQDVNLCFQPDE